MRSRSVEQTRARRNGREKSCAPILSILIGKPSTVSPPFFRSTGFLITLLRRCKHSVESVCRIEYVKNHIFYRIGGCISCCKIFAFTMMPRGVRVQNIDICIKSRNTSIISLLFVSKIKLGQFNIDSFILDVSNVTVSSSSFIIYFIGCDRILTFFLP